jgi:ribosomal protein S18 acetylase RimI-like enzyme
MSAEGAAAGLPASWCSVCVRAGGELIGMGRVVGDGGLFLFVVDIAVAPAWQGRGWGKRIMAALMEQVHARASARAMVGLIADGTAFRLYEQFGFKRVAPAAHGMLLRLQ